MKTLRSWIPAAVFSAGAILVLTAGTQSPRTLEDPLGATVPSSLLGLQGQDVTISEGELQVAGVDDYLFRSYDAQAETTSPAMSTAAPFTVYVGYYASQTQGRTIHSPKNCLPGAGWEALESREERIATAGGEIPVNRYLLQREDERVLVLYWYQGRGRVQANEYLVKLDLLRDSAFRQRSDEALVRVVVPIEGTEQEAFEQAAQVAGELVPAVYQALPG